MSVHSLVLRASAYPIGATPFKASSRKATYDHFPRRNGEHLFVVYALCSGARTHRAPPRVLGGGAQVNLYRLVLVGRVA